MNESFVVKALKLIVGDVPLQWVRLILIGVLGTMGFFMLRDYARDTRADSASTRKILSEYVASNTAWQDKSMEDRKYLLDRVNARFDRLYRQNRWEHESIEAPR